MTQTLTEILQNTFSNTEYLGVDEMEQKLTEIVGIEATHYDSGIDDGADDEVNNYINYSSYQFEGVGMTITFFYGDIDEIIGYVRVRNPIDSKKEKRKHIVRELEKLVHRRFNVTTLTTALESIFSENISLIPDYEDKEDQADWNFTFGTTKDVDTKGVFDIYYLEQRIPDSNNNTLYVTEIGYLFD